MNLNKKIGFLLDNGLNPKFVSTLNENKINFLFEKLSNKKETKEVVQTTALTFDPKNPADAGELEKRTTTKQFKSMGVDPATGKVTLNTDTGENKDDVIKDSEIKEKFESKAQQGLFWARCNKCKSDDCKWCKMAKEFSKSTSKKQYEKMPEKKHPKKIVKYKKKKTNEEFTMANYFDKLSSVYANNVMGKTINGLTKENIEKIIEKNLKPTMKKGDLLKLIESEIKRKKGLNEDFYMGEMEEDFDLDFMSDDDMDMPTRPRGKMGRIKMGGIDAPTIEPGIREPKIKPKEPNTTPEWTPDEDEKDVPDEQQQPQGEKKVDPSMNRDFKKMMKRMDSANYKPIKYKKF
jgi:hypothetical protein